MIVIIRVVEKYIFICLYIIHNPWYNIPYHVSYHPTVKDYLTHPSMIIYVSYDLFQDTSYTIGFMLGIKVSRFILIASYNVMMLSLPDLYKYTIIPVEVV